MRFGVILVLHNIGAYFYKTVILRLFRRVKPAFICSSDLLCSILVHYKKYKICKNTLYIVFIG